MTNPEPLERSIEIQATPAAVWALVSDVTRMSAWSPQVVRSTVSGGEVRDGARFTNLNRQGLLRWPTHGKVVRFEPERDFAFRIAENKTIWSFALEPTATGTRVTQRREVPDGISTASNVLVTVVLGGIAKFNRRLERGMTQTLERVKAEAEAAA